MVSANDKDRRGFIIEDIKFTINKLLIELKIRNKQLRHKQNAIKNKVIGT